MGIIQRVDNKVWQAVSPLIVNEKDGSILVWIPPGEFEMGDGEIYGCPKHRVVLDGYYLGVQCITNRQYQSFVDATGHRPPDKADLGTPIWQDRNYPAEYATHPVACVSWEDAQAYCAWAGLVLPTEAQWERGARGPGNLLYPWGNAWDSAKCSHAGFFGTTTSCPVFAYPQGASSFGTLNQIGNVFEWCRNRDGSRFRVRGGKWGINDAEYSRAAFPFNADPAIRRGDFGFRPCLPLDQ